VRRAIATLALLAAVLAPAAPARADGDPASDTLLYADAHYPYKPNLVAKPLQRALDGMLREAKRKGYAMKVAIIAAQADLGAVPQLFTTPQKYADLLTQEISFNGKPRVLVVLPSGLGGNNLGDRAGSALRDILPPDGADGDALTRTAMRAVASLTKANGTPVAVPEVKATAKRNDDGGTSPLITFGLPVLVVALAALGAMLRGRGAEDEEDDADASSLDDAS
jgi:hypothetical protein